MLCIDRDWFALKAKQQLDKLEAHDKIRKEQIAQQQRREKQFKRHAQLQKQKLQKFRNDNPSMFGIY